MEWPDSVLRSLFVLAVAGAAAMYRHWPRAVRPHAFSFAALEAALAQLRSAPAESFSELEITTVDDHVRFTFYMVNEGIEMRLDSFDSRRQEMCATFEKVGRFLGHKTQRPCDDEFGDRGEITTTLGRDLAIVAKDAAHFMKEVCGLGEGAPIHVVARGFDATWPTGVQLAPPVV